MIPSKSRKYLIGLTAAGALAFAVAPSPAAATEAADTALVASIAAENSNLSLDQIQSAVDLIQSGQVPVTTSVTVDTSEAAVSTQSVSAMTLPTHSWRWWVPYWPCNTRQHGITFHANTNASLPGIGDVRLFTTDEYFGWYDNCVSLVGGFPTDRVTFDVTAWGYTYNPDWNIDFHSSGFFKWGGQGQSSGYGVFRSDLQTSVRMAPTPFTTDYTFHNVSVGLYGDGVACYEVIASDYSADCIDT